MRYLVGLTLLFAMVTTGCPEGKFDKLNDAPESELADAQKFWADYLSQLGSPEVGKQPALLASFFSRPLLAHTSEDEFKKHVQAGLRRSSAGAFKKVGVVALKSTDAGPLLIVESKAGEAAIPLAREGNKLLFAELRASTGEWSADPKRGPEKMPAKSSLLFIKMILTDEQAPVGDRLRAAVSLAEKQYRSEIIRHQAKVTNPIVRLGLGLARIKIDGSDESFVRGFPTDQEGLTALAQADAAIFKEMLSKLSNLGAMLEDPPANEILYKVAAGAPPDMRASMGKALYRMAELSPSRMANAVRNVSQDPATDPTFEIYLEEVKRRGGKARQMKRFLKKFSRIGEPEERKLCQSMLTRLNKAR